MERRKLLKVLAGAGFSSLVAPSGSVFGSLVARAPGTERGDVAAQASGNAPQEVVAAQAGGLQAGATRVAPDALPQLAIARAKEPAKLVNAAIQALGGMGRFISKGDHVLIKPNIGWDRTPEQAANTNPTVVRTLADLCFKSGATKVLVIDNTCNQARRCYVRSGISKAAKEAGATVRHINEKKFKEMVVGGSAVKKWPIYTDFVETDKLINVPIAKHHTLARLTLSMKNWLGAIGGKRNQLHQRLDEACVDLSSFFKPTLTVLDAVRILTANGPQGGNLKDVEKTDTLAAGTDEVAVDAFGTSLFGLRPEDIGYVKLGAARGYGEADLTKLRVAEV